MLPIAAAALVAACAGPPPAGGSADRETSAPPERVEFEAVADSLLHGDNKYLGTKQIERLEQSLAGDGLGAGERLAAMIELSQEYLRVGDVEASLAQIEQAAAAAATNDPGADARAELLFASGTTYLRQAEVQNCIVRHNKDCCIFPLAGGGVHTIPEPVRRARAAFEDYAKLRPRDRRIPWLLNVIAMAAGDYPAAVPPDLLIPPAAFRSEQELPRFRDVAPDLGVDTFNQCGGVVADDLDGDGLIDIATSTFDPRGPLTLYHNDGRGGFEDRSAASHLDAQLGGLNLVGADYDDDGDLDLLVLRGAWLFDDGRIRNSLLRNDGHGVFTDVTREAGLAAPPRPTQSAVWADLDDDGDLDLYVVNESPAREPRKFPAQLYRNEGDGKFVEITAEAGVANDGYGKGVTAGDYDDDGDMDLYVSNIGPNRLYRNDGGMRFVDVAPELGLTRPVGRSFATWFFDYDNDGRLDLFVAGYDATLADVYDDTLGRPHGATPPCLYRNNGDGTFRDVAAEVGLTHAWLPMGANFGDVDNDGWLDLYLSTGDPGYTTLMPNVLLRNDGGRRFVNVTTSAGLGHLQKGHGVAFADFDNDGDQDLYHQLGGFYPGDRFRNSLFANPGEGAHWLTIELRATGGNRRAVGARLTIVAETPRGERQIHRAVGSVSSFGGSPQRQEVGLGDASAVRRIEIVWPTSRVEQVVADPPLDATIRVVEGRDGFERLDLPRFDLLDVAPRAAR